MIPDDSDLGDLGRFSSWLRMNTLGLFFLVPTSSGVATSSMASISQLYIARTLYFVSSSLGLSAAALARGFFPMCVAASAIHVIPGKTA
jgi:hypothetical protein